MNNLEDLEKKINSELTTKINSTKIKHNQLYLEIDKDDLIDVTLFLKINHDLFLKKVLRRLNHLCLFPNTIDYV